tara:strand:- start:321 stop:1253 length:933 start_codon:yes stop_codon:yes gene_type:complete
MSNKKVFLAGHNGLVGSSILKKLKEKGYKKIITKSRKQLNLLDYNKVLNFIKKTKPHYIIIAAAKVGGIYSNYKYQAEFIHQNISIQINIIHAAYLAGVKNLIFLGSSCVYPKFCKQPIKEEYLLSGKLENTNEAYAIAKISGIKMCESYNFQYKTNFKCLMPANTYGPNDNYDKLNSHFFPALIKKIHNLKVKNKNKLVLWGNGKAKREMIYVDDIADACIYFMKRKIKHTLINIGSGKDFSINEYAQKISRLLVPEKKISIVYDKTKPNGTPRKVLDVSLAKKYGWKSKISLRHGILRTYQNFLKNNK